MFEHSVSGRLESIRVNGYPDRSLTFEVLLRNETTTEVALLKSDVRCRLEGRTVAEGDLLQPAWLTLPAVDSTSTGRRGAVGEIKVSLTDHILSYVESRREGEDLSYNLRVAVFVVPVAGSEGEERLGAPEKITLTDQPNNGLGDSSIPQSDWVDDLSRLNWKETVIIELPGTIRSLRYPGAFERWKEARDHYAAGRWEETLQYCHLATEALAAAKMPDSVDDASDEVDARYLKEFFPDTGKGEALNTLMKRFRRFLHKGRHQPRSTADHSGEEQSTVTRADAELALGLTQHFIRYMSISKSKR